MTYPLGSRHGQGLWCGDLSKLSGCGQCEVVEGALVGSCVQLWGSLLPLIKVLGCTPSSVFF